MEALGSGYYPFWFQNLEEEKKFDTNFSNIAEWLFLFENHYYSYQ